MNIKKLLQYGFYKLDENFNEPLSKVDFFCKKSYYNRFVHTITFTYSIKNCEFKISNCNMETYRIAIENIDHFNGVIYKIAENLKDENFFKVSNSVLYIIHAKNTDFYKVGVTNDPLSRLNQISTASPYPLIELKNYVLPSHCVYFYEKEIHDIFELKRKNGEWFELNEKDIALIDCLIRKNFDFDYDKDLEELYAFADKSNKNLCNLD